MDALCTRDGKSWITREFFFQHTSKKTSELYVLVHLATRYNKATHTTRHDTTRHARHATTHTLPLASSAPFLWSALPCHSERPG